MSRLVGTFAILVCLVLAPIRIRLGAGPEFGDS